MMRQPTPPAPQPSPNEAADALLDLAFVGHVLGYVKEAVRRHRLLAIASFVAVVGSAVVALLVLPRAYHTEAKILAQRNLVMPALGNPRRAVPSESDAPTKLATEAILKRDNLLAIIRQSNLMAEWRDQRAPLLKLKDAVATAIRGPLPADQELDAMVGLIARRLRVEPAEGTVTIRIDWPNAEMAYRIVRAAQENFLAERHTTEVSLIGESIAILEGHVAATQGEIDSAYVQLQRVLPARPRPVAAAAPSPRVDQELASAQALLATKRQTIADLTSAHSRRVDELHARLAEQEKSFGPNHPDVARTRQAIEASSVEPPTLEALRREERLLVQQILHRGGTPGVAAQARPISEGFITAVRRLDPDSAMTAEESYARARLKLALDDYQDVINRLNAARIELETARAAFKYRYSVLTPVQVPTRPVSPKPALLLAAGLFLGGMLALAAPVLLEALRGRVLRPWQLKAFVGLDVLGEVPSQ